MSKLNETDIQGFVLRGYNMPFARYLFLHFEDSSRARKLIGRLLPIVTTGQHWDSGKPQSTVNIAFTHRGLSALDLPRALVARYIDVTRESVFYLDPHVCMRCRYRSTELLWQCPHCHEETIHPWTGKMILFANCKCTHCGRDFVIALNQPRG